MNRLGFALILAAALAPGAARAQMVRVNAPLMPMPGGSFPKIPIPAQLPGVGFPQPLPAPTLPGPLPWSKEYLPSPATVVPGLALPLAAAAISATYARAAEPVRAAQPAQAASPRLAAPASIQLETTLSVVRRSFGLGEDGAPKAADAGDVFDSAAPKADAVRVPEKPRREKVHRLPEWDLEEEIGI